MIARALKVATPIDAAAEPAAPAVKDALNEFALDSGRRGAARQQRIGELLRDLGKLDDAQIEFILEQQASNPRRFGELAVAFGLVTNSDISLALSRLHDFDFDPGAKTPHAKQKAGQFDALSDVRSDLGEVLRAVRSQLVLRWFGEEIEQHTLAIISPDHGDGRSFICSRLAMLIAQLDEDVLVVDADLRRPKMHEIFSVDNSEGVSAWLQNPLGRPRIHAAHGYEHLHVLPAGQLAPNPHELLTRRHFGLLLESLAQRYTYVLVDTPPARTCGEALTIAVRASGCLLVARKHRTRLADAHQVASALTKHGVEVLGAVVNER